MVFNGAFADARGFCGIGNGYSPVFARDFQNFLGEFRKVAKDNTFPFDFPLKSLLLFAQRF